MKFLSICLLAVSLAGNAHGQSTIEVGARVFGESKFSIDATFPLAKEPRLHTAFYINGDFALGTYLDWMFALDGGPTGLKFYPGLGPEFYFGDEFNLGVAGNFGVEYTFKFPLTVGIDYRPGIMLTDGFDFYDGNWGIIGRFRFIKVK